MLVEVAGKLGDAEHRDAAFEAVEALSRRRAWKQLERLIPMLLPLLRERSANTRERALRFLQPWSSRPEVRAAMWTLIEDDAIEVRTQLAGALRDEEARPLLLRWARDSDQQVRSNAAFGLISLRPQPESELPLWREWIEKEDAFSREMAIRGMARLASEAREVVPLIASHLGVGGRLAGAAIDALTALAWAKSKDALEALVSAAPDSRDLTTLFVVNRDPRQPSIEALVWGLAFDWGLVWALVEIGAPAIPHLREALGSKERAGRAAGALFSMGAVADSTLLAALDHEDRDVRRRVVRMISGPLRAGEDADAGLHLRRAAIARMRCDVDWGVRRIAVGAIPQLLREYPETRADFVAEFGDMLRGSALDIQAALFGVCDLGDATPFADAILALTEPNRWRVGDGDPSPEAPHIVRGLLARTLGKVAAGDRARDDRVNAALITLLGDRAFKVRRIAANNLGLRLTLA